MNEDMLCSTKTDFLRTPFQSLVSNISCTLHLVVRTLHLVVRSQHE